MIALAFALCIAAQQDAPVLDQPAWAGTEWGVTLRRPFDDWVFLPDAAGGITTVIFQPRGSLLSGQLWGALVLSRFESAPSLAAMTQRRLTRTWRPAFGASFQLVRQDSVEIAGEMAARLVMSGVIDRAALQVEEYLVVRGDLFLALQFRYPANLPADSIAAGYRRALAGLTIGAPAPPPPAPVTPPGAWDVRIDRGALVFDLPRDDQAVAPGWLSSEIVGGERRLMRWNSLFGTPDSALYAVGRFHSDVRRAGNLTIRVWRNDAMDSTVTRATDDMLAELARSWMVYWQAFGAVPTSELSVVETAWRESRGGAAVIFLGRDARGSNGAAPLRRELARTWWGGIVRADDDAAPLVAALVSWSEGFAVRSFASDHVIQRLMMRAGEDRLRVALRTLLVESRGTAPALDAFYREIGDSSASWLRSALR